MNVHDPVPEALDETLGKNAHESRQHQQIGAVRIHLVGENGFETRAIRERPVIDYRSIHAGTACDVDAPCRRVVADHRGNLYVEFCVQDRLQVAATARYQDNDAFHPVFLVSCSADSRNDFRTM